MDGRTVVSDGGGNETDEQEKKGKKEMEGMSGEKKRRQKGNMVEECNEKYSERKTESNDEGRYERGRDNGAMKVDDERNANAEKRHCLTIKNKVANEGGDGREDKADEVNQNESKKREVSVMNDLKDDADTKILERAEELQCDEGEKAGKNKKQNLNREKNKQKNEEIKPEKIKLEKREEMKSDGEEEEDCYRRGDLVRKTSKMVVELNTTRVLIKHLVKVFACAGILTTSLLFICS